MDSFPEKLNRSKIVFFKFTGYNGKQETAPQAKLAVCRGMKMKKHKKSIILIAGVLLAICLGVMAKLFIIGEPVDGGQILCAISENGPELELDVDAAESAVALRGWKYRRDGGTLYISARKVLVSPLFREGHYETSINKEKIDTIILGGKTIW